jgi:dephospho-CoA kinase
MTILALTGGVAAGKSTVTEVLSSLGAHIIDADVLARKAVEPGTSAFDQIIARFGPAVLDESGGLNRGALGNIVFPDAQAREALNAIVHPEVKRLYDEALADAQGDPGRVTIYAVPLLGEARSTTEFDAVVVVDAPAATRVARLTEHRGLTEEQARARVEAQVSDEERVALADSVVDASGDLEQTRRAAHQLYEELVALWPDRLGELSRRFPRDAS